MVLDAREVKPGDVEFLEKLKESKNSVVFTAEVHGTICVMKVFRDRGPSQWDPPDREVNLFVRESTAYARLKAKGLCERGVIPDFYGIITNIQPASWPGLDMFLDDKLPPNAILIEYVPNVQQIDLSNFSLRYLRQLRHILDEIHDAGVLHGDPYPRNMMISADQCKALWIDFDSAHTFSQSLSTRQEIWFKEYMITT
ncbi:hypothetical protein N7519_007017 [Penicillium mononematosum]|uniref:uncharacterized protein n=1 Tax=Penicillium mononematosum TaxID=268346 RepID=UPI00254965E8|nr:uncharacterized protein N7519_007017 [Penicillium mononematosum]KAJ6185716.1 hypothetical protein N7519_007017 [Penicillium mononematosum]